MITRRRIVLVIMLMTMYQAVFAVLIYVQTGPPYHSKSKKRIIYLLCSLTAPSFICFFIVVVATSFLVINLKQTMKNRSKISSSTSDKGMSKERKVVRPVIFICAIFIVCFFPNVSKLLATIVYPKFTLLDPYLGWLSNIFYTITPVFQSISSSTNIFVYYHMSTKFKETFRAAFCKEDVKS
ncbi:chemosensory receptor A [Elysia marginata]|uniref:Chemosensory receptor A n=1 Tax=Elysia marginata TaxID=1093978 RepID=A0AAV4JP48_9GAST|nr:chemosensory receptor A [Elysia marginata]